MLSIIIVNYNSARVLKNCLQSIRETDITDSEVILIDNNSSEESEQSNFAKLVKEFEDLRLKFISLPENRGFGAANNEGAKIAQGKYLFILNPDTILRPTKNPLQKIIAFMESHPKAGIAGPKLLTPSGTVQWWGCGFKTSLSMLVKYNLGLIPKKLWNSQQPIESYWVSGAALCVPKEIFERLRGFDENFFMYFEDEDIGWRVQEAGYKVYYLGDISITHLGGQSFKKEDVKPYKKKYFYESMVYFYKKHYGPPSSTIIVIATFILRRIKYHI